MNCSTVGEDENNANVGQAGPGLSAKVKLRTKQFHVTHTREGLGHSRQPVKQAGGRAAVLYVRGPT
jgi:hypothetical protein